MAIIAANLFFTMIPASRCWILLLHIVAVALFTQHLKGASEDYRKCMDAANAAKGKRDFSAMELAIQEALKHGKGDEYAWRSLAWAQGRQGKWQLSLANARENVRRNGVSGWSLVQLAESATESTDFALARSALDQVARLPAAALGDSGPALQYVRDLFQAATEPRTYQIQFLVDAGAKVSSGQSIWLLMPQAGTPFQTFTCTVKNVVSSTPRKLEERDYIELVPRPGQPIVIEGTLILMPFCLGNARLASVPADECPPLLREHLAAFLNYSQWDPQHPDVQAIARAVKGRTSAETIQKLLDWFHQNIALDLSIKDDPSLGQMGTILKLRRGGCHHMSGLFAAIARAAGVPACVAHGNSLPTHDNPFTLNSPVGHGWVEVYLNSLGWVPVEPADASSLRLFSAHRSYLCVGASNRPPSLHHFAPTITFEGRTYPVLSVQGCIEIKGQRVARNAESPLMPELVAPLANALLPNGTTDNKTEKIWEFAWKPVTGTTVYELWVGHEGAKSPALSQQLSGTSYRFASRSYVGTPNLNGWNWKVRAKVKGAWQPWSHTSTFNVRPPPR